MGGREGTGSTREYRTLEATRFTMIMLKLRFKTQESMFVVNGKAGR